MISRVLSLAIVVALPLALTVGTAASAHESGESHWDGNVYHDRSYGRHVDPEYRPDGDHIDHEYGRHGRHIDHEYTPDGVHIDHEYGRNGSTSTTNTCLTGAHRPRLLEGRARRLRATSVVL